MGGAVRATDSGLACPDWPACYGQWIPPADINMWLEHSHRLWAGVVGILILWLSVWAALRHREVPWLWRLGVIASVLVLVQAVLGAAVVLLQLRAGLVSSHLGMSWIIVACLLGMVALARHEPVGSAGQGTAARELERQVGRWACIVAGAVLVQGVLGSQATGRGAAYVFNAVPIWLAGDAWTGSAREILHVTHRAAGYFVAGLVVAFAVMARRWSRATPGASEWVGLLPVIAALLVVVQVGLGIANVLTRATVWSAIGHLTVASWLWACLVLVAVLGLVPPAKGSSQSSPAGQHESDVWHDNEEVLR
jgi:heme a synthase